MKESLEESLKRLIRMAGTDEGFFVLALHSFIEAFIGADYPPIRNLEHFPEQLQAYGEHLKAQGTPQEHLNTLKSIIDEHRSTNAVRHSFGRLDKQEVLAATFNFLRFCAICKIEGTALSTLGKSLEAWEEKKSPFEQSQELRRMQHELFALQKDNKRLLARTEEWARDRQQMGELDSKTRRLAAELEREKQRADAGAERMDGLRRRLNDVSQEKLRLSGQLEGYRDLDRYVEHVSRFSVYTRTRMDYERSVMKLTEEQQEAVDSAGSGHDHLIRGGAGTGKTIVLLHVLKKIRRAKHRELDLKPGGKTVLLTYTNTLVKYDRYVAEILRDAGAEDLIFTADSFFLSRLRMLNPRFSVEYGAVPRLVNQENSTGFMGDLELATEVEDFLFANMVTREEYLEEKILRRGMRQPLSPAQREAVWAVRDRVVEAMNREGAFSKNYARIRMIQALEAEAAPAGTSARLRETEFVLVDEAQDMTAADLKALKLMASRALIMAGDTGQSIYGVGSPYRRAGVDISGRARILHTSFRNTCQVQELAEGYRTLGGLENDSQGVTAFRVGPVPELYTASDREELAGLLVRKAYLFIEKLGYDPENVTVLAPGKADLELLGGMLARAGYAWANIRDDGFTFKEQKTVRLSTLHSSKGLDFAVVLLFLPGLPPRGEYNDEEAERLQRNLIYVAMTRAMDNLNVFTLEAPREKAVQDVVRAFAEQTRRQGEMDHGSE